MENQSPFFFFFCLLLMVWIAAEVKHRQSEEVCVGRMATSDPVGHPGRAKVDPDVSFLLSAVKCL